MWCMFVIWLLCRSSIKWDGRRAREKRVNDWRQFSEQRKNKAKIERRLVENNGQNSIFLFDAICKNRNHKPRATTQKEFYCILSSMLYIFWILNLHFTWMRFQNEQILSHQCRYKADIWSVKKTLFDSSAKHANILTDFFFWFAIKIWFVTRRFLSMTNQKIVRPSFNSPPDWLSITLYWAENKNGNETM